MKTQLLGMFILVLAGGCATTTPLVLKPSCHSMHLQETLDCRLLLAHDDATKRAGTEDLANEFFKDARFDWKPTCTGTHAIGPVEIAYKGQRFKSDVAHVFVLPEAGTNDFFEIRIFDNDIRTNQVVEVVIQMQSWSGAGDQEQYKDFMRRYDMFADWKIRGGISSNWTCGSQFGSKEVYTLQPRRAGTLLITRELFQNLPDSYPFTPKKILVRE